MESNTLHDDHEMNPEPRAPRYGPVVMPEAKNAPPQETPATGENPGNFALDLVVDVVHLGLVIFTDYIKRKVCHTA